MDLCEREHRGERKFEGNEWNSSEKERRWLCVNGWNERGERKTMWVFVLGWERAERRETWEESLEARYKKEMKLKIKNYYLNKIKCRIDKLKWLCKILSFYIKIDKKMLYALI